ncbi:facilitated trehalose transporter Tret1 isoform X1 [Microplitis demolitor]|uniref:facilitated trehalose transporter Tret1 isoform X1 n=2 Tax=Microplitis demolitor TaxID=69319 RepID=UPI0004CDC15C|nr:facilitated trehalose transporter Tret1 isoform X1 [Microplitis demolitor]
MVRGYQTMGGESSSSSLLVTERTPLRSVQSRRMVEKSIGISQQTLVSASSENENGGRKLTQYIAGLAATLGALAAGMVLGWTSPAGKDGVNLAKEYNIPMSPTEFSWIGSIFNLGAATICVPIGILTDIIGRKRAMLILVVPFTIGWILIIWSNSVVMFDIGRYILGVSGGAFCVTAPMYTGEIAESSIRGSLGSYFQLMLTAGILITYILGSVLSIFALSLISAVVPLIFFGVFFFMPETPTYYLKKGQINEARESYRWLRGPDYNIEPELEAQNEALAEANRNQVSFLTAVRSKAAVKGLFIAFGLMLFQQLSGVNAIIFYSGSIFETAGSTMNSDVATIVVGSMQVIAVFVSTLIVDRLGRRLLLLISSVAMCLTTLILGVYFYMKINKVNGVDSIGWLPLVAICTFIILFSLGFGPIPWMMMGEIFDSQVKSIAGSSACLFNWLMAFIVTKFFSDIQDALGTDMTFWIFSIICAVAVAFVFFIVPETKGKTLEQIQIELGGGNPTPGGFHGNKS